MSCPSLCLANNKRWPTCGAHISKFVCPFAFALARAICLVTQFHGDQRGSLTLWQASCSKSRARRRQLEECCEVDWRCNPVHSLKESYRQWYSASQYCFREKSSIQSSLTSERVWRLTKLLPMSESVSRKKTSEGIWKKYPYVAPELVTGGFPSFTSDTQRLRLSQKGKPNLALTGAKLTRVLGPEPPKRPQL